MGGKWRIISVAALLAGAIAGTVYWRVRTAAAERNTQAPPTPATADASYSGTLRPQHITMVQADTEGEIDSLLVEVGQEVEAGQVLARIRPAGVKRDAFESAVSDGEGQVARAEASVAAARTEVQRADAEQLRSRSVLEREQANFKTQETLIQSKATPRLAWEKAQRDFQLAQQDYELTEKAARVAAEQVQSAENARDAAQNSLLARKKAQGVPGDAPPAEVRSPVSGTVVARNGEPGKTANGDLFAIATDLQALEVVIEPAADVLPHLRPGQPAVVTIRDLSSAPITGEVKEIADGKVVVEFRWDLPAIRLATTVDVKLPPER